MPVIMYTKHNTHTFQVGTGPDGERPFRQRFLPGPNEVPSDLWDRLQAEEAVQNLIAQGSLKPLRQERRSAPQPQPGKPKAAKAGKAQRVQVDDPGKGSTEVVDTLDDLDIAKMPIWDARALIEGVTDVARLETFRKQENARQGAKPRVQVFEALDAQIKAATAMSEAVRTAEGGQSDLEANAGRQ